MSGRVHEVSVSPRNSAEYFAACGIEHAFAGNWTARVEYRFARFDSEGFAFTTGSQRTLRDLEVNAVRVGLSYKLGGMYGGPY